MSSFLTRLFSRSEPKEDTDHQSDFMVRFHRFKRFLGSYFEAYSALMDFEERLSSPYPISMPFLRSSTAKITVSTMQCIMQLNSLSKDRYQKLNNNLNELMQSVQSILQGGLTPIEGPLVVNIKDLSEEHRHLVSPSLFSLAALHEKCPEFTQDGVIITAAAWWEYFNNQEMHDELDRIMIISQDEPGSFSAASSRIQEYVKSSFPPPEKLKEAIKEALDPLKDTLEKPGHSLLVRTIPVKPEHGAIVIPAMLIHTPCTYEDVINALVTNFTRVYQARAILYRLKLGVRDRAMPFCWCLSVVPVAHSRGSAHMPLNEDSNELQLYIRRNYMEEIYSDGYQDEVSLAEQNEQKISDGCLKALKKLREATGLRFEFFWAANEEGKLVGLSAGPLPEANVESINAAREISSPHDNEAFVHRMEGGTCTYPGMVHGTANPVTNLEDALFFPVGSVLLVEKSLTRWSFLLDFAKGAVAGDGTSQGLFARTARRYGRPTILNIPQCVDAFSTDEAVCIAASPDNPCIMGCEANDCPAPIDTPPALPCLGCYPGNHNIPTGLSWLPDSDIGQMAKELAPLILAPHLPDNDEPGFTIDNCKSFMDIFTYSYDRAVREMFNYSTTRKTADAPAKQLVCNVPKQFWIINLADGYTEDIKGPTVNLEEIACKPMHFFWNGFVSKPWDGPPQIDARGLMSVFFEATVNPNLDPAIQTKQQIDRNIVMLAERFLSLRCRFGFHFLALDCLVSERPRESFLIFQFKGGAANLARRVRRVQFIGELLDEFNFTTDIVNDTLTARMEQGEEEEFLSMLRVMGYLFMHTRQLDMITGDETALAERKESMLEDMRILAEGGEIPTEEDEKNTEDKSS